MCSRGGLSRVGEAVPQAPAQTQEFHSRPWSPLQSKQPPSAHPTSPALLHTHTRCRLRPTLPTQRQSFCPPQIQWTIGDTGRPTVPLYHRKPQSSSKGQLAHVPSPASPAIFPPEAPRPRTGSSAQTKPHHGVSFQIKLALSFILNQGSGSTVTNLSPSGFVPIQIPSSSLSQSNRISN
ncbi:hypothetical protein AOLI_G00073760 [Acnodon oligacanthus]